MRRLVLATVALCCCTLSACASEALLKETLTKLEDSRKNTATVAASLAAFKTKAATEILELQQEQSRLATGLVEARNTAGDTLSDLESSEYHLSHARQTRQEMAASLLQLEGESAILNTMVIGLEKRLEIAQDTLGRIREARGRALATIEFLEREQDRLNHELVITQNTAVHAQLELETTRADLEEQRNARETAEGELVQLQARERKLERLGKEVRRERDFLHARVEDLKEGLTTAEAAVSKRKGRIEDLKREKKRALAALARAQEQAILLEDALASEQKNWISLQKALMTLTPPAEPR